ncbi:MAG: MFS transporter, partial [Rhizobiaceae bacterium]
PMLLGLVMLQSASGAASMTMIVIILTSMVADLTEEAEKRTGHRSEAMLLASISFVRKATQGLGALGAGIILSLVTFPIGAERGEVASGILDQMAWLYLAGKFIAFSGATILVLAYRRRYEAA